MPEQKMNSEVAESPSARQAESTGFVYIAAAIAAAVRRRSGRAAAVANADK